MNASGTTIRVGEKNVRPVSGYAFVRMHGIYDATSGLIAIPERFKTKRHGFGTLVAASPTEDHNRAIAGSYADMVNHRVIFSDYAKAPISDGVFRIPIDCIIAIVTDDSIQIQSVAPFQGVERCQWCGPAKSGSSNSMLVDEEGYCYRCGKNSNGEKRNNFSEKSLRPFMR